MKNKENNNPGTLLILNYTFTSLLFNEIVNKFLLFVSLKADRITFILHLDSFTSTWDS